MPIINLTTRLHSRVNHYYELPKNVKIGETFVMFDKTYLSVTKEQAESFERVLQRQGPENLKSISYSWDTLCVEFSHIFIGIEKDGYAHS